MIRRALMVVAALAGLAILAALAWVPMVVGDYGLSLAINIASYTVLATAWSLFSGPTRYVSLATVAFFGIGAYSSAILIELLPWPAVLLIAAAAGMLLATIVGLSTLRLRGVYFVLFSFGLAELFRQLVTWFEVKSMRTLGRRVFTDMTAAHIYWQLLALAVLVFGVGILIGRSRLGLAVRAIGDDETAARHSGIDTTRIKIALFVLSTVFMSLTGAIMAPRWTYIDPTTAFNPVISFTVLTMALLGGAHRLYGPLLGVVPLALLLDYLVTRFPTYFSVAVGVVFLLILYAMPRGIAGMADRLFRKPA